MKLLLAIGITIPTLIAGAVYWFWIEKFHSRQMARKNKNLEL